MKDLFANEEEVNNNEKWLEARMVHGYHHWNENNPNRKNVVSDNLRSTFDMANRLGKLIVHIRSSHIPSSKAHGLKTVSAKEFEGMLTDFVGYDSMPTMLLQNICPSLGLFNGAIGKFRGILYLTEQVEVRLKPKDKKFKFKNMVLTETFDLKMSYLSSNIHQLPKGSIVMTINERKVTCDNDISNAFLSSEENRFIIKLPNFPPHIPDFIVIEFEGYKERGGMNILGFAGAENLVPIPCRKVKRDGKGASKKFGEYRIGFMLECALAITGYKLQGRNEGSVKIYMKDFAHVPGLFNVGCSRVRSPKDNHIPSGEWPSVLDINAQRLNSYVPEAEIFERVIKTISLKTVAKLSIDTGVSYGNNWCTDEYAILEDILIALRSDSAINSTSIQSFLSKLGKILS